MLDSIKEIVRKKYNKGESLSDGGYGRVDKIKDGNEFIVFDVELKTCNHGGERNSGITMWQGIFAHNGKCEIVIKPLALWRDGENQENDRPWLRWGIVEVREDEVVLTNLHDGGHEIIRLDFITSKAMIIGKMSKVEWLEKNVDSPSKRYFLLGNKVLAALRSCNPKGLNDIEAFVLRHGEVFAVDRFSSRNSLSHKDLAADEKIIFFGKECLYGDVVRSWVFVSDQLEVRQLIRQPSVRMGELRILPQEGKILYRKWVKCEKGEDGSSRDVYENIVEADIL